MLYRITTKLSDTVYLTDPEGNLVEAKIGGVYKVDEMFKKYLHAGLLDGQPAPEAEPAKAELPEAAADPEATETVAELDKAEEVSEAEESSKSEGGLEVAKEAPAPKTVGKAGKA